MRGVGIGAAQQLIELVLAPRNGIGDVHTDLTETGSADGDQERGRGLSSRGQILEALLDQIVTRKIVTHPPNYIDRYDRPVDFSQRSNH